MKDIQSSAWRALEAAGKGGSGAFVWPHTDDIIHISMNNIIDILPDPIPISNRYIGWDMAIIDVIDFKLFV